MNLRMRPAGSGAFAFHRFRPNPRLAQPISKRSATRSHCCSLDEPRWRSARFPGRGGVVRDPHNFNRTWRDAQGAIEPDFRTDAGRSRSAADVTEMIDAPTAAEPQIRPIGLPAQRPHRIALVLR